MRDINKSVIALVIPEGAHHLDLRGHDNQDPFSVLEARDIEQQFIKKWIDQARKQRNAPQKFGPGPESIIVG